MIALDTNTIVRLLANDDRRQAERVAALLSREEVWIPKTVLLEAEWVLRYSYDIDPLRIQQGFENLLGLSQVTVEDESAVAQAVQWFGRGLDFADALHLASSPGMRFASFDRELARKSRRLPDAPTVFEP
ncbi:MAG TPA: type II toxin-antitoxin system VapC family toxin [Candidatus Xenobia bacterium]